MRETKIRQEPHANAELVGTLPEGIELDVIEKGPDYSKVSGWHPEDGHIAGYVHNSLVVWIKPPLPKLEPEIIPEYEIPPCNLCGSSQWVILPYRESSWGNEQNLMIAGEKPLPVRARVCRQCAQVQLCLDHEGLHRLNTILIRGGKNG